MRSRILLALVCAGLLTLGVTAVASNMGFKLVRPLTAGWSNYIGLPYYGNYANASQMFADIPNAQFVGRWNNATGLAEQWTGARGTNFTVTAGEAYVVGVTANSNWVIVGSHNDTLGVSLTAGWSNYISVPYHTTAVNASQLFSQIPNAQFVGRWNNATGLAEQWTGARGTNFTLTPGEGYVCGVTANGTWTPAHY